MHGVTDGRWWFLKPFDLFKSLDKTQLLQKQNFILVATFYNWQWHSSFKKKRAREGQTELFPDKSLRLS